MNLFQEQKSFVEKQWETYQKVLNPEVSKQDKKKK
jgi:hypothetical protein